jgi:hypothetical protein
VLACLEVIASHTISASGRRPPPRLHDRFAEVTAAFPIGAPPRDWSSALELVADAIERRVREER